MDSGYVTQVEYKEHNKRMEDEHKRQNQRIKDLEDLLGQNNKLLASVERLATNMENMQKEVAAQGKRIIALESRDGENWRKYTGYIITAILSLAIGLLWDQFVK